MKNNISESLKKHYEWKGKIETKVKCSIDTPLELAEAYTPGVADACKEIYKDKNLQYELTGKGNLVAVITDGTAILGLGNIGPHAGMPVMEGKCALFKTFGNVDAVPIGLNTTDTEEIIKTIKNISVSFGGINLEDISAPRCFEVEKRLIEELDIPVFHDDQHGTAIVVGAALINAAKLANKKLSDMTGVINGAGAAGVSIGKYLLKLGVKNIIMVDKFGIINHDDEYENIGHKEIAKITNNNNIKGKLSDAVKGVDFFVGVSAPNVLTKIDVKNMGSSPIVFAMANPIPEIPYEDAKEAGAFIVGTGSSKYPNQINNALVFPGLFRGALDVRASVINDEMMMATSFALASMITVDELNVDNILPKVTNKEAHIKVAQAVSKAACDTKVNRI